MEREDTGSCILEQSTDSTISLDSRPPNVSGGMDRQRERWQKFLNQWTSAAERTECFVIGDVNLDMNKWMMEMMQTQVELMGFHQQVRGDTQFWLNTVDSLVDHCWTNHPLKAVSVRNMICARSDHNLIAVTIRVTGINHFPNEIISRARGKLDHNTLKSKMGEVYWTELYMRDNIYIANSL